MDFRKDPVFGEATSFLEQSRGLPRGLLSALVGTESSGNPNAVSPVGARGLTQFMPETAKQYNVNVNDPVDSLRGTADYMQDLIHKYNGNVNAALAHYNGGAHNAQFQVNGVAPTPDKVSPANFEVNKKYVADISSKLAPAPATDYVAKVNALVTDLASSGASPDLIINQLMRDPATADLVSQGRKSGDTPEQIVSNLGGPGYQKIAAARAQVDSQNIGTNIVKGVSNAGTDLATGAKQIGATLSGDQERLAQLNAEQAAREADPAYQAQMDTAGSKIGNFATKALPYVAAAAVPELGVPAMIASQGAVGATMGALKPTTAEGQRAGNIVTEGALGAGGAGAGMLIGKGLSATAGKLLGGTDEATARLAAAQSQGLPANAASLSPKNGFWRGVADSMPENGSVRAFQQKADQTVADKVAEGLGVKGWDKGITTDLLEQAKPGIQAGLDNAANVTVTLPKSLKGDLATILSKGDNPLTEGIATNSIVTKAAANLLAAAEKGAPVAGRQLQGLNTELKALVQSQGVSSGEKKMAGEIVGKINDTLKSAMTPEQQAAFDLANKQYGNMKAVEKMIVQSNDTGTVLPRQMLQAVKNGRFKSAFLRGEAPYQELADTAAELYGPAGGKGLGMELAKAVGRYDPAFEAGALINPIVGVPAAVAKFAANKLLGKLATSENPTVVRLLTGAGGKPLDPAVKAYIAKALSGAGGAVTSQ